jgi:hypothetical protein
MAVFSDQHSAFELYSIEQSDRRLRCLQKFSQTPNFVNVLCRVSFFQQSSVVPVHGQQQIEFLKITFNNGPEPLNRSNTAP